MNKKMTKIEAVTALLKDLGGVASWKQVYDKIEKYYPDAKKSQAWKAGIRGVVNREIYAGKHFKFISRGIIALKDYQEEPIPSKDTIRMHSFIEGVLIETGNLKKYDTYTADPSAPYKDNIPLKDIQSLDDFPEFTYEKIVKEAKRIDVIWFDKKDLSFPKYIFEVVDSINTLSGAFERCYNLMDFNLKFCIVAPEEHRKRYEKQISNGLYSGIRDRFEFRSYDEIMKLYETVTDYETINKDILENLAGL